MVQEKQKRRENACFKEKFQGKGKIKKERVT